MSRSNFNREDYGSVCIFGVLKQRHNLSPASMSFYRHLHLLMKCHFSIVTPSSKARVVSSANGKISEQYLQVNLKPYISPNLLLALTVITKGNNTVRSNN